MNYKLYGENIYFDIPNRRVHDDSNRPRKTKGCTIVGDIMYIHPYISDNLEQFYYLMENVSKIVFESAINNFNESKFNQIFLPRPSIKQIVFNDRFNVQFVLTPYITHLSFGQKFNRQIILNSSIVHVHFGLHFNKSIKISKNLSILRLGCNFNQSLVLNKHLKILCCSGVGFASGLSKNIKYLDMFKCCVAHIDLPKCLKWLGMQYCSIQSIKLTPNIKYLLLNGDINCYQHTIMECYTNNVCFYIGTLNIMLLDNLPNNVRHITSSNLSFFCNIPNNTCVYLNQTAICKKTRKMLKKKLSTCDNFLYISMR